MDIVFSAGFSYADQFSRQKRRNRSIQLGSFQLLEWLELHLGFPRKKQSHNKRTVLYFSAIKKAISLGQFSFIQPSFEVAPWDTTQQLLSWRDHMASYSWDFKSTPGLSERLELLANIEELLDKSFPMSISDRWNFILNRVEKSDVALTSFSTLDQYLDPQIELLVSLFKAKGIKVHQFSNAPISLEKTNLNQFKLFIEGNQRAIEKIDVIDDDQSLVIIEADSEFECAISLVNHLEEKQWKDYQISSQGDTHSLQQYAHQNGWPVSKQVEDHYQISQLFSGLLFLLFEPLDPEALIRYLQVPYAPIPFGFRQKLASSFAEKNGFDLEEWKEQIDSFAKYDVTKLHSQFDRWFLRKRHKKSDPLPVEDLIEFYVDLNDWAVGQKKLINYNETADALDFQVLIDACEEMVTLLNLPGRILDGLSGRQVIAFAKNFKVSFSGRKNGEIGSPATTLRPSACTNPVELTIWWNFVQNRSGMPFQGFLNTAEKRSMAHLNIPNYEDQVAEYHRQLLRPIFQTTGKLILCIPKHIGSKEADVHPLSSYLEFAFNDPNQLYLKPEYEDTTKASLGEQSTTPIELPLRKVQWQVSGGLNAERWNTSFSALKTLWEYPDDYALRYLLDIKAKSLPSAEITAAIKGNLAHAVIEDCLLKLQIDQGIELVGIEATKLCNYHIPKIAAAYLLPKNKIHLKAIKQTIRKAVITLADIILSGNWQVYGTEVAKEVEDFAKINGKLDLVLQRNQEFAVIDVKWGSAESRYREIKEGKDMQLQIYRKLLVEEQPTALYSGYFIVTTAKMLTVDPGLYDDAIDLDVNAKDLWPIMERSYKKRLDEISEGRIDSGEGMDLPIDWENNPEFVVLPHEKGRKKDNRFSAYKNIKGYL